MSRDELDFVSMPVVCLGWGGEKTPKIFQTSFDERK